MSTPTPPGFDPYATPGPSRPDQSAAPPPWASSPSRGGRPDPWAAPAPRGSGPPSPAPSFPAGAPQHDPWTTPAPGAGQGSPWPSPGPGGGQAAPWGAPADPGPRKPFFTRWWFLALLAAAVIGVIALVLLGGGTDDDDATPTAAPTASPGTTASAPEGAAGGSGSAGGAWTPAAKDILFTHSGTGDERVPLEAYDEPVIAVVRQDSEGLLTARTVNEDGNAWFTLTMMWEPGQDMNLLNIGYDPIALEVEAEGPWTVEVVSTANVPTWDPSTTYAGVGSQVVRIGAPIEGLTTMEVTHDGDSNIMMGSAGAEYYGTGLLNEIGEFRGTAVLPAGSVFLEVSASDAWSVTRNTETLPAPAEGPAQSFSGDGYAVLPIGSVGEPAVATIRFEGAETFRATAVDGQGISGGLYSMAYGAHEGTVPFNFDGDPAAVAVEAIEPWSIEVTPLGALPAWDLAAPLTGEGDAVVRLANPAGGPVVLGTSFDGDVLRVQTHGADLDPLMNYDDDDTTEVLPSGTAVIVISSDGPWTLTPQ